MMIYNSFLDFNSDNFLQIGNLQVKWYAVCILTGILLASILGIREAKKFGISTNKILDGVLISDIGLEIDEDFDKATDEEREEILKFYLESLKDAGEKIQKNIESDPTQKAIDETITQLTKLNLGTAEFVKIDEDVKEKLKEENNKKLEESKNNG